MRPTRTTWLSAQHGNRRSHVWSAILTATVGVAGCAYPEYTYVDRLDDAPGSGGTGGLAGDGSADATEDTADADATETQPDVHPQCDATDSSDGNLALNKAVTTSSVQSGEIGAYAVDGDTGTRWWTSKNSTLSSEWIVVDLGAEHCISRVLVNQGDRYAQDLTIQLSADNATWTTAATTGGGIKGSTWLSFAPMMGRYVKMDSTLWYMDSDRVKLLELEIYP